MAILFLLVAVLGACGDSEIAGGDGASCAFTARFSGHSYEALTVERAPEEGEPLGSAALPACSDEDGADTGEGDGELIEVARLPGVSPDVALAMRGRLDTLLVRKGVRSFPQEVVELMQAPHCDSRDSPIKLSGPWLGILGADGETERNLVPPYDVDLFVEEASDEGYRRSFLSVRVPIELGRPLDREDIRSSLWEGGEIDLVTTCKRAGFVAEQVRAYPPAD
jgi:Family of unknown function (DUF6281)